MIFDGQVLEAGVDRRRERLAGELAGEDEVRVAGRQVEAVRAVDQLVRRDGVDLLQMLARAEADFERAAAAIWIVHFDGVAKARFVGEERDEVVPGGGGRDV